MMNSGSDDDATEDECSPCFEANNPGSAFKTPENQQFPDDCPDAAKTTIISGLTAKESDIPDWCKEGEMCMSLYDDGIYYRAIINGLHTDSNHGNTAGVTYIGYELEGVELIPITNLKKIPKKQRLEKRKGKSKADNSIQISGLSSADSLFSHLHGNETDQQMRSKYEEPDEEELENELIKLTQKKQGAPKSKTKMGSKKERKRCRLSLKFETRELPQQEKKKKSAPARSAVPTSNTNAGLNDEEFDTSWDIDGFDDEDMEKPHFDEPAPDPSVPLVLSPQGEEPVIQVPAPINCRLRDYQRDGVKFLYQHYRSNTGAILGDDMGLGKTVQVIAFMAAVLGKTNTKADVFGKYITQGTRGKKRKAGVFLVVCPGCVLYNWKDELDTWGYFQVKMYHGSGKQVVMDQAARGNLDVVLTTYDTMRINVGEFAAVKWLAVIMDEAHKLKDPTTKVTMAAKQLKVTRRFGLTGTPLQNRWSELWCVLDWANPNCLGSGLRFDANYGKAIRKGQRHDANKRELALGRTKSMQFQAMLNKWMLRRTKDLIADQLPNKDDKVVFCSMTSFQEDVYVTLLQSPDVQLVRKKDHPCDCGSGECRGKCCYSHCPRTGEALKSLLMRCFQLFLKVANHTALLMPSIKQTKDQRQRAKVLCDEVFKRHPQFAQSMTDSSFQTLSDPTYCGKMKVLDKLMHMFEKEKSKVLLFSQSTQLLNILENYVTGRGLVYSRLDGSTAHAQRARLVREFNTNPEIFVCLVSTKAGGLGLNFTGANVVIIFDPTWNPSNDLQAQDRAYRIGQRRDVQVLRLISSGTIEEMMYLRQIYKQQMANIAIEGTSERRYFMGVEGEKDHKGELFGIENLFSYRAEGANLIQDIIKRTDRVEAGLTVAKYQIVPDRKPEEETEEDKETVDENCHNKPEEDNEDGYDLEAMVSQYLDDDQPITSQNASEAITSIPDSQPITNQPGPSNEMASRRSKGDRNKMKLRKKKRKPLDFVSSDSSDSCDDKDVDASDESGAHEVGMESTLPSCSKFIEKKRKSGKRVSFRPLFSSSEESDESGNGSSADDRAKCSGHKVERLQNRKINSKYRKTKESGMEEQTVEGTENAVSVTVNPSLEERHHEEAGTSGDKLTKERFTKIKERLTQKSSELESTLDPQIHGSALDTPQSSEASIAFAKKGSGGGIKVAYAKSRGSKSSGRQHGGRSGAGKGSGERTNERTGDGNGKTGKQSGDDGGNGGVSKRTEGGGYSGKRGGSSDDDDSDGNDKKCVSNIDGDDDDGDDDTDHDHDEDGDDDDYVDEGGGGYMSGIPSDEQIDEFDSDEGSYDDTSKGRPVRSKKSMPEKRQKKHNQADSKRNKVEELLEGCGVSYTHANRAVVRATKAERHMSKRAIQDVYELRQYSQQPANCFATMECSSDESDDVAVATTQLNQAKHERKAMLDKLAGTTHKFTTRTTRVKDAHKSVDNRTELVDNKATCSRTAKQKRNKPGKTGNDVKGKSFAREVKCRGKAFKSRKTGLKNMNKLVFDDQDTSTEEDIPLWKGALVGRGKNTNSDQHENLDESEKNGVRDLESTKAPTDVELDVASKPSTSDSFADESAALSTRAQIGSSSILDDFFSSNKKQEENTRRDTCGPRADSEVPGSNKRSRLQKSILDDFI